MPWRIPFACVMFICAVCASLVSRMLEKVRCRSRALPNALPTIFVGVVSFCDREWPKQIEEFMHAASHPDRVVFGVIEYVHSAEESLEEALPARWRHIVRLHTVSERIAKSQREARSLCLQKLFRDETYVLFSRSIHPVAAWDELLIRSCAENSSLVLTTQLSQTTTSTYPRIEIKDGRAVVTDAEMLLATDESVPILVWRPDFVFGPSEHMGHMLEHSDDFEVSGALASRSIRIMAPGRCVGTRASHPRGLKSARSRSAYSAQAVEYAKSMGVDLVAETTTSRARLGITPTPEASETIAKFGSVVAARVALQTAEAEDDERAQFRRTRRRSVE